MLLDARGDLAAAVIELAAVIGIDPANVKFFDLREKVRPVGFNPLHGSGEPYYRALGVLDAVAAESESWGVQIAESLRNAVLLLAEAKSPLTHLEPLFYDASHRHRLTSGAMSAQVSSFWGRYDALSPDRQAALAAPVLNKVSLLFATESLRRLYGHQSPVDLGSQLAKRGSVTLVSLAVDELHSAGWMTGSLFLSSICREIFSRVGMAESDRCPVRLYVDEFEHFGMKEFETILAEGRRFKFSAVLAHQTLAQLAPKMRSMVLGNVGVKAVFRAGRQDADILNKDLTGNAKAFDLPSLPVGDAILWRRGSPPLHIEVNAPLLTDVGRVSERARRFRNVLRSLTPQFVEEFYAPNRTPSAKTEKLEPRDGDRGRSLEDWL